MMTENKSMPHQVQSYLEAIVDLAVQIEQQVQNKLNQIKLKNEPSLAFKSQSEEVIQASTLV